MKRRLIVIPLVLAALVTSSAAAEIEVDGQPVEVIDAHLHPGHFGHVARSGRAFIMAQLPPFALPFAPAVIEAVQDTWSPEMGVRAQCDMAGVDHAVLLAVYSRDTIGYFSNRELEAMLLDPRNTADDGEPWAYGMASIDFHEYLAPGEAEARLEALDSYFEAHPGRVVGIKLAHAHAGVAFDDEAYLGVYDVAARRGVPVLLHTGGSPFPNTRLEAPFADPAALEAVIEAYDGEHGMGRVDFVLAHAGQGDRRYTEHAIELAVAHDNVWLELSALGRPAAVDLDGAPITDDAPQYERVLAAIQERGLVAQTIFASDGPQYSGYVRGYVRKLARGMTERGFTIEEIRAVMGGNFRRLFLASRG